MCKAQAVIELRMKIKKARISSDCAVVHLGQCRTNCVLVLNAQKQCLYWEQHRQMWFNGRKAVCSTASCRINRQYRPHETSCFN